MSGSSGSRTGDVPGFSCDPPGQGAAQAPDGGGLLREPNGGPRAAKTQPGPKPPAIVDAVVEALVQELHPRKVILFGSAARGDMGAESDLDVLVVLDEVEGWRDKMTRGYKAIIPLRVAVDLLVVSQREVDEWGHVVGHVINDALLEGRVLYDTT